MRAFSPKHICVLGAVFCALALGAAVGSERFGGLVPCALCLLQRWPYRIGIFLGLAGALLPARLGRAGVAVMALTFLAAASAASIHVGVEAGWWKSPLPECTAPNFTGLSPAERFAKMTDRPAISCEDPTYIVGPVTMAQANLTYALAGFAAMTILGLRSKGKQA
jgi:disulfide bond formation protein DsbB